MRRPAKLFISDYINYFPVLEGRSVLAIHGYSLAVDLFHPLLAEHLRNGELKPCLTDNSVEQLLTQRGYLIHKTAEEESAFVSEVRRIFKEKRPGTTEFRLKVSTSNGATTGDHASTIFLEHVFIAFNELNQPQSGGAMEIDLRDLAPHQMEVGKSILLMARDWGFRPALEISDDQLESVLEIIRGHRVSRVSVHFSADGLSRARNSVDDVATPRASTRVLEIISQNVEVELCIVADDIDEQERVRLMDDVSEMKRRIQAEPNRYLTFIPLTEREGPAQPKLFKGLQVTPLHDHELADYRQLQNYIWSAYLVRYKPSFLAIDRIIRIGPSGEISRSWSPGRNWKVIGQVNGEGYELNHDLLQETAPMLAQDFPDECKTCKLSLICASNCRVALKDETEHFQQKLERFANLLVLNQFSSTVE